MGAASAKPSCDAHCQRRQISSTREGRVLKPLSSPALQTQLQVFAGPVREKTVSVLAEEMYPLTTTNTGHGHDSSVRGNRVREHQCGSALRSSLPRPRPRPAIGPVSDRQDAAGPLRKPKRAELRRLRWTQSTAASRAAHSLFHRGWTQSTALVATRLAPRARGVLSQRNSLREDMSNVEKPTTRRRRSPAG